LFPDDRVQAYRGKLWAYARRRCRTAEEAEDCVQETFCRACRDVHRFQWGTDLGAWLRSILKNVISDRCRQQARSPTVEEDSGALLEQLSDDAPTPEKAVLTEEEWKERQAYWQGFLAALESSPRLHRAALLYALEREEVEALQEYVEPQRVAEVLEITEEEWRAGRGQLPLSDAAIAQKMGLRQEGAKQVRFARHSVRKKLARHGFRK
jgi:RNA polymerase sigma factor (sigma-70 family)